LFADTPDTAYRCGYCVTFDSARLSIFLPPRPAVATCEL